MEWVGKTRKKVGSRGHADYDVLISVIKSGTQAEPDKVALAVVFRNKAYEIALALRAETAKRTVILPNSGRLYFMFESESRDSIGVKLCKPDANSLAYRARFPLVSKTEAQTIKGAWIGEYSIKYDKEEEAYYIERGGRR